jgi:hypothetical protein
MYLSELFVEKFRKSQSFGIIRYLRKRFVFKIYMRNISCILVELLSIALFGKKIIITQDITGFNLRKKGGSSVIIKYRRNNHRFFRRFNIGDRIYTPINMRFAQAVTIR